MLKLTKAFRYLSLALVFGVFTINSGVPANASQESSQKNNSIEIQENLVKQHYSELKSLGFPDETINFLAPDEINNILNNKFKFISSSSKKHLLFIEDKKEHKEIASVNLTDDEFNNYKIDKTSILKKKLIELSKKDLTLNKYISVDNTQNILSSGDPSVSETIDGAVLTLSVDAYDSSVDGYIYKTMGCNFQWSGCPSEACTNAVAVSYSGYWWTTKSRGGYVIDKNGTRYTNYTPTIGANGGGFSYSKTMYDNVYGRVSVTAGNTDSAVPGNYNFNVFGGYSYGKTGCTGISIGIDAGFIPSFSVSYGMKKIDFSPNPYDVVNTY
jgi:hypothetical protein